MNIPAKINRKRSARRKASPGKANAPFFESAIQRKCEQCENEDKQKIQKKGEHGPVAAVKPFFSSYMNTIGAKGQPLPEGTRSFFESRLPGSFADVRIHTDQEATMAARDVNAKAFTWQNHIVFNRNYFNEQTTGGKQLLAHELTHVLQQRQDGYRGIQRAPETEGEVMNPSEEELTEAAAPGPQAIAQEQQAEQQEEKIGEPETLPDFSTFGKAPEMITVFGKSVTVQGETTASFDGGVGTTQNLKAIPARDCDGCGGPECVTVTGKLVITYNVSTNVTLPDVPEGLTPCQQQRVKDTIDSKIKPHEDQHVAAFNTYKGTVTLPINYTGCKAGLAAHVQAIHDADSEARQKVAKALSAALDPFVVPIDLDCEDKPNN
ncbi:hypothetical protein GCM10023189_35860 [Nibrella saemangeumensis]|uniref:eCIS core domain-containing protein n=1 Tax=Nibrella saemangeumensis TaxID=1084526 RepID=A0ABP8N611_9BACT